VTAGRDVATYEQALTTHRHRLSSGRSFPCSLCSSSLWSLCLSLSLSVSLSLMASCTGGLDGLLRELDSSLAGVRMAKSDDVRRALTPAVVAGGLLQLLASRERAGLRPRRRIIIVRPIRTVAELGLTGVLVSSRVGVRIAMRWRRRCRPAD
jgi:hypothetical protein